MKQMTKTEKIRQLINEGIALVDAKYGEQSNNYLPYHNVEHTRDVMEAAEKIGRVALLQCRITELDLELLVLAACYHDVEHGMHGSENERESIRIVTEKMQQAGVFSETDIAKVIAMIEATIVISAKEGIIQSATEEYITKIIADADLSNFGKPFEVFWDRSKKYLLERDNKKFENIDFAEKTIFIDSQIKILENHVYNTDEASSLYPSIKENITMLSKLRAKI
jgi:predicted metal-dependent HD superfamily phosphohydrolase